MEALDLFIAFLRSSALSVGGLSALPLLRQELVTPGFVSEQQVLEALAIGRLSTGPSGLYVVSLGYFAAGGVGAVLAVLASCFPPLGLVAAATLVRRHLLSPWAAGLVRGVALSSAGLIAATGISLLAPDRALLGLPVWQLGLALGAAAITARGAIHPGLLVGVGALAGLALGR